MPAFLSQVLQSAGVLWCNICPSPCSIHWKELRSFHQPTNHQPRFSLFGSSLADALSTRPLTDHLISDVDIYLICFLDNSKFQPYRFSHFTQSRTFSSTIPMHFFIRTILREQEARFYSNFKNKFRIMLASVEKKN